MTNPFSKFISSALQSTKTKETIGLEYNDYGTAAYEEELFDDAVNWFKKSADLDYPPAQFNLALCYEKGEGVPVDLEQAVHWYQKASKNDYAEAQIRLGTFYDTGKGVPQSSSEANSLFLKAAMNGHLEGLFRVGSRFLVGDGVKKDSVKALFWLAQAAIKGHVAAQVTLGMCYESGYDETFEVDKVRAKMWYEAAAEQGDEEAIKALKGMSRKRIRTVSPPRRTRRIVE